VAEHSFSIQSDELSEIVVQCDPDGIILSWSRAVREITGFSADEVVGYHLESIVAEDSRHLICEILAVHGAGIPRNAELRVPVTKG
jgi:PAS domain S-box-containing protein